MRSVLFVLCILSIPSTCSLASAQSLDSAAEIRAIQQARADQNRAIARRDLDRVAVFWASNVMVTAGLGTVVQGADAYRNAFELDASLTYERTPTVVEVSPRYTIAWEEGVWTGSLRAGDGSPVISGRYSAQWIKIDGAWRIRSELFVAMDCKGNACRWPVAAK